MTPTPQKYCVSQRAEPAERCAYSRNPRWIIRKPLFVKVMQKQIQLFPSSTPSHQKSSFYYVRGTQIMVLLASIFHILLEMSSWLWKQLIMSLQLGNCCLGKQQITICTFLYHSISFLGNFACGITIHFIPSVKSVWARNLIATSIIQSVFNSWVQSITL